MHSFLDANCVQDLYKNGFQKKSLTSSDGITYSFQHEDAWNKIQFRTQMTSSSDVLSVPAYGSIHGHPIISNTRRQVFPLVEASNDGMPSNWGGIPLFSDKFHISSSAWFWIFLFFTVTCWKFLTESWQQCGISSSWTITDYLSVNFDVVEEGTVMNCKLECIKKLRSILSSRKCVLNALHDTLQHTLKFFVDLPYRVLNAGHLMANRRGYTLFLPLFSQTG